MEYSLRNFRIFGDEANHFELAPITLLIGENNSGKSTLTKSMMLFQNFFAKIRRDFTIGNFTQWDDYILDFTEGNHRLGNYETIQPFESNKKLEITYTTTSNILPAEAKILTKIEFEPIEPDGKSRTLSARISSIKIYIDNFELYSYKRDSLGRERYITNFRLLETSFIQHYYKRKQNNYDYSERYGILYAQFFRLNLLVRNRPNRVMSEIKHDAIFWTPILDKIWDCISDTLLTTIKSEINDENSFSYRFIKEKYDDLITNLLILVKEDFELSGEIVFGEYYKKLENKFVEKLNVNAPKQIRDYGNKVFAYNDLSDLTNKNIDSDKWQKLSDNEKFSIIQLILDYCGANFNNHKRICDTITAFATLIIGEPFVLNDKLVNLDFLELYRANVQRLFTFKTQGTSFNSLLTEYTRAHDINKKNNIIYKKGTFINKWIKNLTKYSSVDFEYTLDGEGLNIYLYEINPINKQTYKYNLADVGFGMTPLLSVLIQIELRIIQKQSNISKDKNNCIATICIEEPESNLHPKYQSRLAEIFIDAYSNYDIEFLLETHSEYLVRKFQLLVKHDNNLCDKICIHNLKEGTNRVIHINNNGLLDKPFWSGFYDEASILSAELL